MAFVAEFFMHSVKYQVEWEPAGLGARPAVCTTPSDGFAGKALSGIRDAEGTVREDLEFHCAFGGKLSRFFEGQFSSQRNPHGAELRGPSEACRVRTGHLCGGVQSNARHPTFDQPSHSEILYDDRVDAAFGNGENEALKVGKLVIEHECIGCHVAATPSVMNLPHDFGQLLESKIRCTSTGVEAEVEPKVNGIRSCS